MGISTHELLLVMRARDEATRVLRGFGGSMRGVGTETAKAAQTAYMHGGALMSAGTAMLGIGASMIIAFNDMADAAIDYNEQVGLTATQLDDVVVSMDELRRMGLDTGRELPVKFEQIQGALYDIFSSLETSGPEAEKILKGIGRAAVAGKVDMETSGRAIIAIMNAWKLSGEDVNKVNDVMFQLVRKGVGTYDEFGKNIGKAIPSAVKTGQSVEDLAGAMAFMTRNGLSAAMASTSVARAMDALAKPKAQENLKELGVSVVNARGEFLPFANIMEQMREKLENLTPAARAAKLNEIFKGSGGTIQAMRVFNLGLEDSGGLLQQLTADMHNAQGATEEAYNIMSNTPQGKLQALSNQFSVLRVELGERLLPIKMAIVGAIVRVIDAFNGLSPKMKDIIVKAGLIFAALSVVLGIITLVAGVVITLMASLSLAGVSLGLFAGIIGGVVLAVAALVAIGILVWKNWDTIKRVGINTWNAIWNAIKPFVNWLKVNFLKAWEAIAQYGKELWSRFGGSIMETIYIMRDGIMGFIRPVINAFKSFGELGPLVMPFFKNLGEIVVRTFSGTIWPVIKAVVNLLMGVLVPTFRFIGVVVREAFRILGAVFGGLITIIKNIVGLIMAIFAGDWAKAWHYFKEVGLSVGRMLVSSLWAILRGIGNIIGSLVTNVISIIGNFVKSFGSLIKALVMGVINFFKNLYNVLVGNSIIPDMVNDIISWIAKLPGRVISFISKLVNAVINFFLNMAKKVVSTIAGFVADMVSRFTSMVSRVTSVAAALPGRVWNAIKALVNYGRQVATDTINAIRNGINTGISVVVGVANTLVTRAKSALKTLVSGALGIGQDVARGIRDGINNGIEWVTGAARSLADKAKNAAKTVLGITSPSKVFAELGKFVAQGFALGIRSNTKDVTKASVDLAKSIEKVFRERIMNANRNNKSITNLSQYATNLAYAQAQSFMKRHVNASINVLTNYSSRLTTLGTQIKNGWATFDKMQADRAKVVEKLTEQFSSGNDILKAGEGDMLDYFRDQSDRIQQYSDDLMKLSKLGLSNDALMRLSEAGLAGEDAVNQLLNGGKDMIKEVNSLQAKITATSAKNANTVADTMYKAGINAQYGFIKGLQKEEAALKQAAEKLANSLVSTIKKVLGIKSPSRVLMDLGLNVGEGFAKGILATRRMVSDAMDSTIYVPDLGPVVSSTNGGALGPKPFYPGYDGGMAPGAGGVIYNQEITVNTEEIDPVKHAADLGFELSKRL